MKRPRLRQGTYLAITFDRHSGIFPKVMEARDSDSRQVTILLSVTTDSAEGLFLQALQGGENEGRE